MANINTIFECKKNGTTNWNILYNCENRNFTYLSAAVTQEKFHKLHKVVNFSCNCLH